MYGTIATCDLRPVAYENIPAFTHRPPHGADWCSDELMDELLLREDYTRQIRNPLLRFLHGQAYGRRKLPLYAGLQDRDELLVEIRRRAGLAEGTEDREQGTGDREQGTG